MSQIEPCLHELSVYLDVVISLNVELTTWHIYISRLHIFDLEILFFLLNNQINYIDVYNN